MIGLIIKDLLNLKRQFKIYLIFIALYGIISFVSKDSLAIGAMLCMLFTMVPITALSYDERASWEKYALAMPVSKNDLVFSKYVLGFVCAFMGAIIFLIINIITIGLTVQAILPPLCICFISVLFLCLILPVLFKFGVEKGRILMMIILCSPIILSLIIRQILPDFYINATTFIGKISPFTVIVFLIVAIASSVFISQKIYRKKEF